MTARKENSTNNINRKTLNNFCGVTYALDLIGGRWKLLILYKLEFKKLRFSELKKQLPNVTERMLALHLKELEKGHLIQRHVYQEVPARVEYELTPTGLKLSPMWHSLERWGEEHRSLFATLPEEAGLPVGEGYCQA